jgi:putative ABC transport system ATP-binding protein
MAVASSAGSPTALRMRVAAQAVDLTRIYGSGITAVLALDSLSAAFSVGELTAVIGPADSGKSTLLECLAGLEPPDSGVVMIGDTNLATLRESELTRLRRERLGFIFQSFNLLPMLTALENIELPLRLAGRAPEREWLDRVIDTAGVRDRLADLPTQLTGAQQQRVATARALAGRPDIVLADEPTGDLDPRSSGELLGLLRRSVHDLGQTVVMVTRDASAAEYADRVLLIARGRIVGEMTEPTVQRVLDRLQSLGV